MSSDDKKIFMHSENINFFDNSQRDTSFSFKSSHSFFFENQYNYEINPQKILDILRAADELDFFFKTKFSTNKRFSIKGMDALIPALYIFFEHAQINNIKNISMGMTHRGRVEVLKILFNDPDVINYFEKKDSFFFNDVIYHKGYSAKLNNLIVDLLPNASHLESIGPIVLGHAFANNALPLILHGDGAFSGQGVVYENFQLHHLKNYNENGAIHIVLDNEIAFTTSTAESRSTTNVTDIAKTFDIPVVSVDSNDPDSVCIVFKLAFDFWMTYKQSVIIHIKGYRYYGHNEIDTPDFSNPLSSKEIKKKKSIKDLYQQKNQLKKDNVFVSGFKKIEKSDQNNMLSMFEKLSSDVLRLELFNHLNIPKAFNIHPILKTKYEVYLETEEVSFEMAEKLVFLALEKNKISVRLSGQDSVRGTFSHRNAILYDQDNGNAHSLFKTHAFINSPLSEYACLGFEYGVSLSQKTYVIWEAQFGDFANGAQIIIDQYINSAFEKWGQNSCITLLLPHGMENQGPEHSSARLERFLQMSAQNNWIIAQPTTPANYYHLLLKKRNCPLVIMSPKSLLRKTKSAWQDFNEDLKPYLLSKKESDTSVFCSGKIYYELLELNLPHSIIALEQLYPFPTDCLQFQSQKNIWIQDEPKNMGAFSYIKDFFKDISYIGREAHSSPAGNLNQYINILDRLI